MLDLKIIYLYFVNSLQTQLANPVGVIIFVVNKVIRYSLFLFFLYLLTEPLIKVGGYTAIQLPFIYLTFSLVDTASQMLFREVYRFRNLVVSGNFDLVLTKPTNPLIRTLFGGPDFIDAIMLVLLVTATAYLSANYIHPQPLHVLVYILLILNALIIACAFHIFVLGFGIVTLSVDHLVMMYRDLAGLMRIPVDFFTNPLRLILTFVVPIGIMFTFPAKALLGQLSFTSTIISFLLSTGLLFLSHRFWYFALKKYSLASS
jgi:ABC-2 type transport system permease protein